jgi:O-antigen/teichoic acid export membrane protein
MATRVVSAGVPAAACRPYPAILRARLRSALATEPLLRNGHVLTISSLLTAGLGAVFWLLATSWYSAETVGRSYAALGTVALLAGIGQLNLDDLLVRFVPVAGRHTRPLVLHCYAIGAVCSALAALGFLALLPELAPELGFLRHPAVAVCFVAATAGYALFVLQDGALTGLRRADWVLGENALFALVKTGLLAGCAAWALDSGILLSWTGALVTSLLVTNYFLLKRAVPVHQGGDRGATAPPQRLVGYAAADYLGAIFRMAAYDLMPLLVLNVLGAAPSAYFSLAWVIAYTLYQAAYNMGSSLIVEAVRDPGRLGEQGRRVLRHSALVLGAAVAAVLVAAPWLLRLFGPDYAAHGTGVLRLLALAALPNLVVSVAIDAARARRRLRWAILLQVSLCALVTGLGLLLMPELGIAGVGWAWLVAETVLCVPLLATLHRWLPIGPRRSS